jgi:hypothetical protein
MVPKSFNIPSTEDLIEIEEEVEEDKAEEKSEKRNFQFSNPVVNKAMAS